MKTVETFANNYVKGKKISVVTCYDYWSAQIINDTNIDAVLVGDSTAMVMHGYENTINADLSMMVFHTAAVSKGIKNKFIIADIPFLAHLKGREKLIEAADRLFKVGANAIKIEGANSNLEDIKYLVENGLPVMGHLGMTPQSVNKFGGFKVQGKENNTAEKMKEDAKKIERAGCFALVLEMVPANLAKEITEQINIPTIGIGAGKFTSGQVLVLQDLLGMNKDFNPKFLRKYLDGFNLIEQALNDYDKDVKENSFPSNDESYK